MPAKATVGGNYSKLLRKIAVPQDQTTYGDFFESGYFPAIPSYAGFQDLPAGHWVYVVPNWFIWKESKKPRDSSSALAELLTRNDPFSVLLNKDVSLRIMGNETIKGKISENRAGFLLLSSPNNKKGYWEQDSCVLCPPRGEGK